MTVGSHKCTDETQKCLDVFRERVTFIVQNAIPEKMSASRRLAQLCRQYEHIIMHNEKAKEHLRNIVADDRAHGGGNVGSKTTCRHGNHEQRRFQKPLVISALTVPMSIEFCNPNKFKKTSKNKKPNKNKSKRRRKKRWKKSSKNPRRFVKYSRDDETQIAWKLDDLAEPQRLPFYKNANVQGVPTRNEIKTHRSATVSRLLLVE